MEEVHSDPEVSANTSSSGSSIFLIRPVDKIAQLEINNCKIRFDVYINGRKKETLLDTGSPISIMQLKMTKWLQAVKCLNVPPGNELWT